MPGKSRKRVGMDDLEESPKTNKSQSLPRREEPIAELSNVEKDFRAEFRSSYVYRKFYEGQTDD